MKIRRMMKSFQYSVLFVVIILISTPICAATANSALVDDGFYSDKAREYASIISGIPAEKLIVGAETQETFPMTGVTVIMFKVRDGSGNTYPISMDQDGNQVDYGELYLKEMNAQYEKYGKLDPELYDTLSTMQPDEKVMVWIWLKEPSIPNFPRPAPGSTLDKGVEEQHLQRLREIYALQEVPVIDFLNSQGIEIDYASQYAPIVFAEVTPETLRALNDREDVDSLALVESHELMLDSAVPTVHADSVWNNGYDGSGVKVAVVEEDGIEFSNPYLADGSYFDPNNPAIGMHATEVAGIIASTHLTYTGVANGVLPLYSATAPSTSDNNVVAATEWAINQGVNILQNSWGKNTTRLESNIDRYFDHVVWTDARTIVVSAGNIDGYNPSGYILSPGIAYNVITVGAFDDRDTSNWNDDIMADYSAWIDPFVDPVLHNGRRQKPEVVAPSGNGTTQIMTTNNTQPWVHNAINGTSFSAPVVAGEAALLMDRQNWLTWWPECVKAIVMASAVHNIEGDPKQSDYDGVGGVDCLAADEVLANSQVQGIEIYPGDFPKDFYIPMEMGQTVRAVICWDNHPQDAHPPVHISGLKPSDFDLEAYNPSGGLVDVSEDYYDTYEIVQFTAQATGTYKVRMTKWYYAGSPEYVGFAYCYL